MYLIKTKPENTYYKTHQKVCNIHPKALWTIIENDCYVYSPINKGGIEISYPFEEGDEIYFAVRFNGIKRQGNFESPITKNEVGSKVSSILSDSVEIIDMDIEQENPIYMKEKNHKFYPWFVTAKGKIKNKNNFTNHVQTGIGRSKRLGFGMIIL